MATPRLLARLAIAAALLGGGLLAMPVAAQVYSLTSSSTGVSVAPTGTEFATGFVETGQITLTVSYSSGPKNTIFNTFVRINCTAAACLNSGTKGGLEWRVVSSSHPTEAPATAYAPLTFGATGAQLNATAVQMDGNARTGAIVSTWNITVQLRYPLAWATDAPGTSGSTNVVFELVLQ